MSEVLSEDLVEFATRLVGEADAEYAVRWMQSGPLTVQQPVSRTPGIESLMSSIMLSTPSSASVIDVQSLMTKLTRRKGDVSNFMFLLYLLRDRSSGSAIPPANTRTPVVSLEALVRSVESAGAESKTMVSSKWEMVENFLFGPIVTESDIVRDLVFVIQGVDGKFVRLTGGEVKIVCPTILSPSHVETLITGIGEHGILVRAIEEAVNNHSRGSMMEKFFIRSVLYEISKFKSIAAVIESDITKWTLIRMMSVLILPIRKLRYLSSIVNDIIGVSPEDDHMMHALNTMYMLSEQGVFRKSISIPLFQPLVTEWINDVWLWISRGELRDNEIFFVSITSRSMGPRNSEDNRKIDSGSYFWNEKFRLDGGKIPNFISKKISEKIFKIGKSVSFVRAVDPNRAVGDILDRASVTLDSLPDILTDREGTEKNLVNFIIQKHELLKHCDIIRKYILLVSGDFANEFITSLKTAPVESKFDLANQFDQARDDFDEAKFINRFSFSFEQNGRISKIGIKYNPPSPVDVVLHSDALGIYEQCFYHYFRIISLEKSVSKSWVSITAMSRKQFNGIMYLGSVDVLLREVNFLRARLWFWIHELRYVICYEVLEKNWRNFSSQIATDSLDNLIELHDQYIKNIRDGMFVGNRLLDDVLVVIERFINAEIGVYAELDACMQTDIDISPFKFKNIMELLKDMDDAFAQAVEEFDIHLRDFSVVSHQEFYQRVRFQLSREFL